MACVRIRPGKPHFFQPLLPGFRQELLIPISFSKYLDGGECNKDAILRSSSGKLWPVKINGRRLEDGWTDFVRAHDLHVGDFVVFRHDGDMVFDVMVFDPSACEREFPPSDIKAVGQKDSSSAEPVQDFNESQRTLKKKRAIIHSKAEAASFPLELPYFVGTVQPSYLETNRLHIPAKFARANGLSNRYCEMILRDQKGRSWPAALGYKKSDGQAYIVQGWRDFQLANGLNRGDTFTLVLIKNGSKPIVNIYVGIPKAKQVLMAPASKASSPPLGHRYFIATVNPHSLKKSQVDIPMDFAKANGLCNKKCEMILRDQIGRLWPATLMHMKSNGQVYIKIGWSKLVVANGLKEGDLFMLELLRVGKKLIMNFYGGCMEGSS